MENLQFVTKIDQPWFQQMLISLCDVFSRIYNGLRAISNFFFEPFSCFIEKGLIDFHKISNKLTWKKNENPFSDKIPTPSIEKN